MKKIYYYFLALILCLTSCSSGPENTARKFTESMAKGDIKAAQKYSTEGTGKLLEMLNGLGIDKMETFPDFKFNMVKDSIVGDTAWVTYKTPEDTNDVLTLIKDNGEWKVSMGK